MSKYTKINFCWKCNVKSSQRTIVKMYIEKLFLCDLLHRLLSFVTQFKYISFKRPREGETDRYKTNYTNLVKRIALESTVVHGLMWNVRQQGFQTLKEFDVEGTSRHTHKLLPQQSLLVSFLLPHSLLWLICFIFKLIWIDLNLLIYNLLCQ